MPVGFHILDGKGSGLRTHVHDMKLSEQHSGLLTLSERFLKFRPEFHPFLSDTLGAAMNTNASFGGTPEIIHNGGTSTEWTASAVTGVWDFSTGGVVTQSGANDGDTATFAEETPTTIDISGFTALSGKIDLNTYTPINHQISFEFDNAGVQVGDTVDLDDFIDTADFASQTFVIPLTNFNFASDNVDGFSIIITRSGGAKPAMTFDDITLQQTGGAAIFKATTPPGTRFHITELRIAFADALAATLLNGTMHGLAYDKLLAVSALTNGILFRRVENGETLFAVPIKQLGDFLATGSNIVNAISDGTNTFITLLVEFPEPIVLKGGAFENFLSFTIADDLSGLLQFTAAARGALEI